MTNPILKNYFFISNFIFLMSMTSIQAKENNKNDLIEYQALSEGVWRMKKVECSLSSVNLYSHTVNHEGKIYDFSYSDGKIFGITELKSVEKIDVNTFKLIKNIYTEKGEFLRNSYSTYKFINKNNNEIKYLAFKENNNALLNVFVENNMRTESGKNLADLNNHKCNNLPTSYLDELLVVYELQDKNGEKNNTTENISSKKEKLNVNKLPNCPKPDITKKEDFGLGGRTEKWNNCWGVYKSVFNKHIKGLISEGEWQNGFLNGNGMEKSSNGMKNEGEFKNGKLHGTGKIITKDGDTIDGQWEFGYPKYATSKFADGETYTGEFENGMYHGKRCTYCKKWS
jgi:hypothetical protein